MQTFIHFLNQGGGVRPYRMGAKGEVHPRWLKGARVPREKTHRHNEPVDSNPEPSCWAVRVLAAAPPCCQDAIITIRRSIY